MSTHELQTKTKEELENLLIDLKKRLSLLKERKNVDPPSPGAIEALRKDIAQTLVVLNERNREFLKRQYIGKRSQTRGTRRRGVQRAGGKKPTGKNITPSSSINQLHLTS
ncbi:60S ribosomal protein uL29 RPL35B KNAG_0C04010 [Huiozyma naganishii CBS 8797]|uniref:50S ribosomal protein L29 n=1 Tax=Huiozyma naganishii (strain ATCC MYA-139 / BCRC 22969 / CBS 8797 / KCTC 17520 / NBRC 10181 / NCYC 3082 / Yp74L-3) TaxID=1071383 RepID=J7R3V7_HUIN7|nr:hypothetical protein KNAG_0C04010 [Kazachstania naganishii CBS 8797]CCK69505.1 hypothetical protein KNAG_0C04010 [Kazachstania naganishii CBS 8797]